MVCYQNERYVLLETGPGKLNAAVAVAYIAGKYNIKCSAWLNVGIAGHRSLAIGAGLLCHKISDAVTKRNYYPDMACRGTLNTAALLSVDSPETEYTHDCLYDMEAAAFFPAAARFSGNELVQSFKVVSDNRACPAERIDANFARELIFSRMADIREISDRLCATAEDLQDIYRAPDAYGQYLHAMHFTVTQREQLKSLLRRWRALSEHPLPDHLAPHRYANAKHLLRDIATYVDAIGTGVPTEIPH